MIRKWEVLVREAKKRNINNAIEIGCCPFPLDAPLAEGYGLSTYKFGEYCRNNNIEFSSCDKNPESIENASKICALNNIPVLLYCMDGAAFLKTVDKPIDLLYLDNASEPEITLEQFKIAESKMSDNGVIILEDCHSDEHGLYSKGTLTIPYALENGYELFFEPVYGPSIMCTIKRK